MVRFALSALRLRACKAALVRKLIIRRSSSANAA
jgi:hypothetical protein